MDKQVDVRTGWTISRGWCVGEFTDEETLEQNREQVRVNEWEWGLWIVKTGDVYIKEVRPSRKMSNKEITYGYVYN